MGQELFAPILPVLTYHTTEEAVSFVQSRPSHWPCIFSPQTAGISAHVQANVSYGGGCVNDTIIHLATSQMGFGGVGMSGMGSYHGKVRF